MSNCSYISKIVMVLMQILMVLYNLIGFSERTTHVEGSIIIIKPTHTLYSLLGYISSICLIYVEANFGLPSSRRFDQDFTRNVEVNVLQILV
jgi:hypothetical protein